MSKPMHMYVWTREPFFYAVAQAEDVQTARRLLLDECGGTDGSCPERAAAVEWIREQTPMIWYGRNAEFALTDSAELRENELMLERLQKELAELRGQPMSNSRGKARRRRCNIDKQEKVVTLLWNLAREAQREPKTGCVISSGDGTKMSDHVLRKALAAIMDTFGYDVLEVQ